jgi:hypothetical protein
MWPGNQLTKLLACAAAAAARGVDAAEEENLRSTALDRAGCTREAII